MGDESDMLPCTDTRIMLNLQLKTGMDGLLIRSDEDASQNTKYSKRDEIGSGYQLLAKSRD